MTVNGNELRCVMEFIKAHQKSEAHHVKEWNKHNKDIATTTDEKRKEFLINRKEDARRALVREQGIIKEFAILLGKTTKHVDIRTPRDTIHGGDLLEVKQVEVIEN